MVNVNATDVQGDAHLIRFPNGEINFIDVSNSGNLLVPYLKARRIRRIDTIFISHPHKDHYGGLIPILNAKIKIKRVFMNVPDRSLCDQERDWGCDYPDVLHVIETLKKWNVKVLPIQAGAKFRHADGSVLEVLYAYDGVRTPVGRTDINDTSLIMRLTVGPTKALFAGDLNDNLGSFLAHRPDARADILKVPHHGTEGVAPNAFFDQVDMGLALIPSPKNLWLSDRSKRVRTYFENKGIPYYVNGMNGNVTVLLNGKGYTVQTELPSNSVLH